MSRKAEPGDEEIVFEDGNESVTVSWGTAAIKPYMNLCVCDYGRSGSVEVCDPDEVDMIIKALQKAKRFMERTALERTPSSPHP